MNSAEWCAYHLGRRRLARGDVEGALEQFTRLVETRSHYADVHYMMGTLLERKDELDSAAQSLWRALRLNPGYTEALLALASIYERQGDFDRSQELAERAQEAGRRRSGRLDPTTRGKLANQEAELGDAFRDAGELGEAIEIYRRALARCPEFHDIRHRLGVTLREAGLPHQALAEFRRVLERNPRFLDAAVQLALTLYTLGRGGEAVRGWNRVLEQDPSRDDARMYLRLVAGR